MRWEARVEESGRNYQNDIIGSDLIPVSSQRIPTKDWGETPIIAPDPSH